MTVAPDEGRAQRILSFAGDRWRSQCAGDGTSETELLARHPDLMPELAVRVQLLRRLAAETAIDRRIAGRGQRERHRGRERSHDRSRSASRRLLELPELTDIWFDPGTEIGRRYTICSFLGQGGLGAVFLAHDKVLNKSVALKFFRNAFFGEERSQIEAEVALSQRVSHVNVCRVHDLNVEHEPAYLSME